MQFKDFRQRQQRQQRQLVKDIKYYFATVTNGYFVTGTQTPSLMVCFSDV